MASTLTQAERQAVYAKHVRPEGGWPAPVVDLAAQEVRRAEDEAARALAKRRRAHPLAGALDRLTDEARRESESRNGLRLKVRDFGNGHREVTAWRVQPDLERSLERAIDRDIKAPRGEGDREKSKLRAARRAKQTVRHRCKAMNVNSLWTLTYRECMTDRDQAWKDFDLFRRRAAAVLGEFHYVAVIEPQERGALHFHLATHMLPAKLLANGVKVKSWDVMRAIWRRIVGEGNFDESKGRTGSKGWRSKVAQRRRAGAIASYIAGYVAKDMLEVELNRKRFSASKGTVIPDAVTAEFAAGTPVCELLALAMSFVGQRVTTTWWDAGREVFYAESDDTDQGPPK